MTHESSSAIANEVIRLRAENELLKKQVAALSRPIGQEEWSPLWKELIAARLAATEKP